MFSKLYHYSRSSIATLFLIIGTLGAVDTALGISCEWGDGLASRMSGILDGGESGRIGEQEGPPEHSLPHSTPATAPCGAPGIAALLISVPEEVPAQGEEISRQLAGPGPEPSLRPDERPPYLG